MNPASKNKSLVAIIIFLLVTNIIMLIFFLVLNKPMQKNARGKEQSGMSVMLQKEVGFSQNQLDTYANLRKEQLDSMHILFDQVRKAKIDFYNLLFAPQVSDSALNNAANEIAEKQKNLDLHMYNHFKVVRNICTPDQLQKFDSSILKVINRMTGRQGRDQKR